MYLIYILPSDKLVRSFTYPPPWDAPSKGYKVPEGLINTVSAIYFLFRYCSYNTLDCDNSFKFSVFVSKITFYIFVIYMWNITVNKPIFITFDFLFSIKMESVFILHYLLISLFPFSERYTKGISKNILLQTFSNNLTHFLPVKKMCCKSSNHKHFRSLTKSLTIHEFCIRRAECARRYLLAI